MSEALAECEVLLQLILRLLIRSVRQARNGVMLDSGADFIIGDALYAVTTFAWRDQPPITKPW